MPGLMKRRCCVFQPFDKGGPFDRRYDEILAPAIDVAGLDPYRVDRDDAALKPIETLHEEIGSAPVCLADITTNNPNVMYEIDYAMARGKDVVSISGPRQQDRFPFDITHFSVIEYETQSTSDLESLRTRVNQRLLGVLDKQSSVKAITESPLKPSEGLQHHERTALALVMANRQAAEETVTHYRIREDMGYNSLATGLALTKLARLGLVKVTTEHTNIGETYEAYKLTTEGEDWLRDHGSELTLRAQ